MKKLLSLLIATAILLTFVACVNQPNDTHNGDGLTDDGTPNKNQDNNSSNNPSSTDNNSSNGNLEICSDHNYVDNICSVCNCSLWDGTVDTSWYSVIELNFTINTAAEFAGLIDIVNNGSDLSGVKITLANHIDMNNKPISPIGATADDAFAGKFDGGNYSISNIAINMETLIVTEKTVYDTTFYSSCAGLFGYSNGSISNLDVKNLSINISSTTINDTLYIGGLVAYSDGDIENCSVKGEISTNAAYSFHVGGLAGEVTGDVTQCTSNVLIVSSLSCDGDSGSPTMGGLVARSVETTIIECASNGSISFTATSDKYTSYVDGFSAGGLIGASFDTDIINCYSTVDITASIAEDSSGGITPGYDTCDIGGLLGTMHEGTVTACYSTGNLSLSCKYNGYAGALIGNIAANYFQSIMSTISVKDCFATGNVYCKVAKEGAISSSIGKNADKVLVNCYYLSSQVITGDEIIKDGTPATQNDLKNIAFYQNRMAWDANIWNFIDGEYPTLK